MSLKLSKLFFALFIFYQAWFQGVFFSIPNMLLFLGAGMIGFIILNALQTKANILQIFTAELIFWILFVFTSLVFGLFVAENKLFLISALTTYSQFLVMIFGIIYISIKDKKIDYFINVLIILATLLAVTTLMFGIDVGGGRISLGHDINPNSLAITMAIGVCCILYKLNFNKLIYTLVSFSGILLLMYVILLTGSRKSLIAVILLLIYWGIFVVYRDIKSISLSSKIKGILSIIIVFIIGYYLIYPYFADSIIFQRLLALFEDNGGKRVRMYSEAYELFGNNIMVGIGFNNFRAVSIFGTYSHSTYAEALACTGIIGCILYFIPYLLLSLRYLKFFFNRKMNILLLKQGRILLGMFGMILFLGVGIIHFYDMLSNIAFGLLIAFYISNKKYY